MEYERWQKTGLHRGLAYRRGVIISGARQVGKTTLSKQALSANAVFRSLDDVTLLAAAKEDPSGFLRRQGKTMVIDEIQKALPLIPEIKKVVDEDNSPGQYVLTGSANVQTLPAVHESLAGRVRHIRLRPLTEGELLGRPPCFLQRAFTQDFQLEYDACSKDTLLERSLRGGYPEAVRLPVTERKEWHMDYANTLLTHDLRDIAHVRRFSKLEMLLQAMAAWSGKYMNVDEICTVCGLNRDTMQTYFGLLEQLFLCERVPAWTKSDYGRTGKRDKLYMSDTGLMASLLHWNHDNVALDPDRSGKLIESFVFTELAAQVGLSSQYAIYQYRDRDKHEIDFIIEDEESGCLLCIEVKGGSQVSREDFRHIRWFTEKMAKPVVGIVFYSGKAAVQFAPNQWAIPSAALWGK